MDEILPKARGKVSKLWVLVVAAVAVTTGGGGYALGSILFDEKPEMVSEDDGMTAPRPQGFSAGYSAPVGVVAVRIDRLSGGQILAAELEIGFSSKHVEEFYRTAQGIATLREVTIMALSDIGLGRRLDTQEDWIAELAVSLVTQISKDIAEVVEVRVNRAERLPSP